MTFEYLIRTANPSAYFPPDEETPSEYRHVQPTGTVNGDTILDILHTENPLKVGDSLIGGWNPAGEQIEPFDEAAYEQIRPLGNNPPRDLYDENGNVVGQTRGGDATQHLLFHHFAGWGQRQLGSPSSSPSPVDPQPASLYPESNEPFAIEVRHKLFDGNPNPAWDGWGWRAEILGGAQTRDPSARAVGIYRDAEATNYWYTTGAFTQQASEWQTDPATGDPLTVWATEYNPGLLGEPQAQPADVHHAVLLGSAQEGYQTLPGGDQNNVSQHLYWDREQGQPPPSGSTWQDTGSTVTGIAGAGVYNVDDTAPFDSMAAGTPLRIGGEETAFDRVHQAGAPGIIVVDDHNAAAVGEAIWALL